MEANEWKLIPWDGNPALKLKCWRKTFGRGHVSVGVGSFLSIVFSFGANSGNSFSSTRWNYDNAPISEIDAMKLIDEQWPKGGRFIFPHPAKKH